MGPRLTADERREQLLDATKALAASRGFHAVSIEAVAREAGITRPIVYGHFRDLSKLLEALVERESARALGQLTDVLTPALDLPDPGERMMQAMRAYIEAVSADPDTWRLVLMPTEGAPASLHRQIDEGRDAIIGQLAGAVRPGMDPPDPELTARMLSAFADEAARLHLRDAERYPVKRLMDQTRWAIGQLS
ncbi:MAG TPA: helix-turn-helix domain-containing protein [Thermoleophilaceae bacterium]|nr:helix-turn-helix domain-containing protein [Thermoleophilaceae bacterium]